MLGSWQVTFAARYGVIPVSADSVQACEGWLSEKSVTRKALEGNGHPYTVVQANYNAISKRSWIWTPL